MNIREEVLSKVSIPMYFYNIILPNMDGYFDTYQVNFESDTRACCPLHDEDTPSFRFYENTNSFYCFGCQRGGSVINLHIYFTEKLNGTMPSKEEAIIFLYNYFIKDKQVEFINKVAQKVDKEVRLNTDKDIVKFNYYRLNLEEQITSDNKLKFKIKKELWELLDTTDILLSKNLIKTSEAEDYIKSEVKRLITKDAFISRLNIGVKQ